MKALSSLAARIIHVFAKCYYTLGCRGVVPTLYVSCVKLKTAKIFPEESGGISANFCTIEISHYTVTV